MTFAGVSRDPLPVGRQDHQGVVHPRCREEHYREHGQLRGHQSTTTTRPPIMRIRWPLEICRTLHQVQLQLRERGAVCQLSGGSGGDLSSLGRG